MSNKVYWKSIEDLNNDPALVAKAQKEFAQEVPLEAFLGNRETLGKSKTPRRDFLKFLGFSVTAASLAACETPVRKTVPYLIKPEEVTPGIANWYATTYNDGGECCSVLVKNREGRPIKIEGNKFSGFTKGGTSARVQASVLSLYDSSRLQTPVKKDGTPAQWADVDKDLESRIENLNRAGGNIRLLTSTINSPTLQSVIADFTAKYPGTKHVSYDAISYAAMREANKTAFQTEVIPGYDFSKADVIVSFGADFLGTWLSPVQFARQYAVNRKVGAGKKTMSKHIQYESMLTLAGSNADVRVGIKPSQIGSAVVNLYNLIASKAGQAAVSSKSLPFDKSLQQTAEELWSAKGKALVVCGVNDPNIQLFVNAINYMLGSYGNTIDLGNPLNLKNGSDTAVQELIKEMNEGKVDLLMVHGCNPSFDLPAASGFAGALSKVKMKISFAGWMDETASGCDYVLPDHHYLESWGDASPCANTYSLIQPAIYPLFNTRSVGDSLLVWMKSPVDYSAYLKSNWEKTFFTKQSSEVSFEQFWMKSLHDGVFELAPNAPVSVTWASDLTAAAQAISGIQGGEWEITLYEKISMGNGSMANNPWLQEMPDPISKVVWDNYITMSPRQMEKLGLNTFFEKEEKMDVVEISVNGKSIKAPVLPQPGQPEGTIALAVGYGRKGIKVADTVEKNPMDETAIGVNAFSLAGLTNGFVNYHIGKVSVSGSAGKHMLVTTQTSHTLMGRKMVKETTLAEYKKDAAAGNEKEHLLLSDGHEHKKVEAHTVDLWATEKNPGFDKPGLRWNMAIDLNSCIGCGNCLISCQAENNVSVVGKDEVRMNRDMHWIRIDRYYTSERTKENVTPDVGLIDMYKQMEIPEENPQVVFQPMMCQHCNHAPCETVCPVIATTHSNEGLNQMTYNRCVGTKYCANNCPYKVRRFNWFKYFENDDFDFHMNSDLGKMVLNPDVTVRSRGVMEKCSMCIQRIQEGKLNAKKEGRVLADGEINTACAQSCPTNAITFGDGNNTNSAVSAMVKDERAYFMLEELNVQPSVFYMVKVRNTNSKEA